MQNTRKRKPQDLSRWPCGAERAEQAIDRLCGCQGRYDCDCVSVFNRALSEAWYDYNSARHPA